MNNEDSHNLKRTILYYPSIGIPSGEWLRKAILYWDEIGSIVPQSYEFETPAPYSPDIDFLKKEGVYRPFRPSQLGYKSFRAVHDFGNELADIILSREFQEFQKRQRPTSNFRNKRSNSIKKTLLIHEEKGTDEVFEFLMQANLAQKFPQDHRWYEVEENTALVYMALLAKYLADQDSQATIPGTDIAAYQRLCFQPKNVESAVPGLNVSFLNAFPVPRNDISFDDILKFKHLRRDHLLKFRLIHDELQKDICDCESQGDANEIMVRFSNKLERELHDLEAVLKDSSISTIAGSFDALFRTPPLVWLAALVVAFGKARNIVDVPVKWTIGGAAVAGAVSVSKYLIDKRNEKRKALRSSPLSYLYFARRDGIIRSIFRSIKGT